VTWHLTFPKKLMIYVGFPAEPEGIEARRTDFNRYFRQLDNPDYIPRAHDAGRRRGRIGEFFESLKSEVQRPKSERLQVGRHPLLGPNADLRNTWNGKEHKRTQRNRKEHNFKNYFCSGSEGGGAWIAKCSEKITERTEKHTKTHKYTSFFTSFFCDGF